MKLLIVPLDACRSNKRANLYNQQIRAKIKWQEKRFQGDMLMVVRNNYHWLDDNSKAGFIVMEIL